MGLYIYKASENDKTHIFRIAATESDIDNFNLGSYTTITVSDSEYNNIRNSTKTVESYDGTTFTYLDNPIQEIAPGKTYWCAYNTADDLQQYINLVIEKCNNFLEVPSNASNALFSDISSYKNYLSSFDVSTLTYPMNINWEKYCEDNSIDFFHPLQIP